MDMTCKECAHCHVCEFAKEIGSDKAVKIFDFKCPDFQNKADVVNVANKIKPGDKVYFSLYDDTAPEESEVGAEEVFDVGTKGIYFYSGSGIADFYSYDDIGKVVFLNRKEAEDELLCIMAKELMMGNESDT